MRAIMDADLVVNTAPRNKAVRQKLSVSREIYSLAILLHPSGLIPAEKTHATLHRPLTCFPLRGSINKPRARKWWTPARSAGSGSVQWGFFAPRWAIICLFSPSCHPVLSHCRFLREGGGGHTAVIQWHKGVGGGGDVILLHISFFPLQLCFNNRFGWLKMFWLPNKHEFEGRVMAPCRPKSATSTITEHIGRDRVQLYSLSTAVFPVPQSSGQSKVMWKRRQEVNLWTFQVHHHSELDYKEHC